MATSSPPATTSTSVAATPAPAAAAPSSKPPQAAAAVAAVAAPKPPAAPAPAAPSKAAPQQPVQRAPPVAAAPQAAAPPVQQQSRAAAVDAVIDDVLAGDLNTDERRLYADEAAYKVFCEVRAAAGDSLDAETSARLNELARITEAEQEAIMQKTNRVVRKVLRPLGYTMLQLQGLDPLTVHPTAAREALEKDLTAQQQAVVDAEAERLFKEVYLPELRAAAEDAGLEDPDQAWEEFGRSILLRQPEEPEQQSAAAIAVPAAVAGALVALVVSKLFGWLSRRRQRRSKRQQRSSSADEESFYEEEEELLSGSDSGQDAASAYAE